MPAAPDTPARRVIRIIRSYGHTAAWHCATCRATCRAKPARHRSRTPARRVIRIIRIIRSYGHTAAWHCATLPRLPGIGASRPRHLPGIEALPSPRHTEVGILPPRSGFRLRYFAEKPITGPAPKVRQRCCPCSIADRVFFHHSHALPSILAWAQDCHTQSWRGHRIATLNPGVGTGLPHSILAWAQDCHTQSWRGHRIAPAFPRKRWKRSAVQHYAPRLAARIARKTPAVRRYTAMHSRTCRPDCPQNSASVLLCSSALTDSPPGFPASSLASKTKEMGKIKLFPTPEYSSKQPSDPVAPLVPRTGIFLGPSKSGKTVTLISLILEQYRGVFERIYIFSPSIDIDDGVHRGGPGGEYRTGASVLGRVGRGGASSSSSARSRRRPRSWTLRNCTRS